MNIPNRRKEDQETHGEAPQIEDDLNFYRELAEWNKKIARERIAEYRAKQVLEDLETEVVH